MSGRGSRLAPATWPALVVGLVLLLWMWQGYRRA